MRRTIGSFAFTHKVLNLYATLEHVAGAGTQLSRMHLRGSAHALSFATKLRH
jgi:hypothetical protein